MSDTPDYIQRTPTDADMAAAESDLMESPEFLRSEIERLRSDLASMKEQCARVAERYGTTWGGANSDVKIVAPFIAAAIRALPTDGQSPSSEKEGGKG